MFKDLQLRMAKRACQSELAQIIELMEGHKAAGAPAGDEMYRRLDDRATKCIINLQRESNKLGFPVLCQEDVLVGVPTLRTLRQLAGGRGTKTSPFAIGVSALIAGTTATVAFALERNLYIWLTSFHWLHR